MKQLSSDESFTGSYMSYISVIFSSICPRSARPGSSSNSGFSVSTSAETNAMHLPFGATLCEWEQRNTYLTQKVSDTSVSSRKENHQSRERAAPIPTMTHDILFFKMTPYHSQKKKSDSRTKTYMSDLRPSCFCGKIIWTESESLVFGIGWLMKQIARTTFPTFFTCRNHRFRYNWKLGAEGGYKKK